MPNQLRSFNLSEVKLKENLCPNVDFRNKLGQLQELRRKQH
jgi:hypothetical protein